MGHRHGKSVFHAEALGSRAGPATSSTGYLSGVGMGDIVNLRTARKQAKRRQEQQRAAANRVRFGRSKAERVRDTAFDDKARRVLEGHRIETGDEG